MRLGCFTIFLLLFAAVVLGAGLFSYLVDAKRDTIIRVEIKQHDADVIAQQLSGQGVLSPWGVIVFRLVSDASGASKDFQSGTFPLPAGASVRTVIRKLTEPQRSEVTVTVPEGSDLRDLFAILQKAGILDSPDELYRISGKPASFASAPVGDPSVDAFLADKPKTVPLEGYLFPDTYRFFTDAMAGDIVKKMLLTFDQRTAELRASSLPEGLTFHDVLTLASIVEAEVRTDADRRMVADVFLRRLAARIGLQADSTVNYVTGKGTVFTTKEDRATDSLWNTYKYRGLPPGPIGNPGLAAIQAVLQPTKNEYLYFLTAPDGAVHYAKTLDEQEANRKRYLNP